MDEIDKRKLFGADDEYTDYGKPVSEMQATMARYEAALIDIATADGGEGRMHGSLRWIEGYEAGIKTQAQRARFHLGQDAPPEYPANMLVSIIERYKAALDAIIALENIDAADDMEGTRDFWDGVDTGLSACRQIARTAKKGVGK